MVGWPMFSHNRRNQGFTLAESLMVLLILSILLALAIPAYGSFVIKTRITTATSELHGTILYARSEAIKRGGAVIICRSSSTRSENPQCDKGPDALGLGWGSGWIVFHDKDRNRRLNAGDEILMMRASFFSSNKDGAILTRPTHNQLDFNATGQTFGNYMSFIIKRPLSDEDTKHDKYICLASGGRARVSSEPCS
ncbi:GspH/FimT family pseudopilin [Undibacterium cyanobacteriorum]|uniref:GspH/FimT family pseudopilin n=1 Tax=Undibacterium cyanobacteriorum TaxID=3073561 RepID=UPI0035A314E0